MRPERVSGRTAMMLLGVRGKFSVGVGARQRKFERLGGWKKRNWERATGFMFSLEGHGRERRLGSKWSFTVTFNASQDLCILAPMAGIVL